MDDVELAIRAAAAGAEVVRDRFGTPLTRLDKGGGDFAADVDVEAERAMIELLRTNRPADQVDAEKPPALPAYLFPFSSMHAPPPAAWHHRSP